MLHCSMVLVLAQAGESVDPGAGPVLPPLPLWTWLSCVGTLWGSLSGCLWIVLLVRYQFVGGFRMIDDRATCF